MTKSNKNVETTEETVKVEQPITPNVEVAPKETEDKTVKVAAEEPKEEPKAEEPEVSEEIKRLADEVEAGMHGSGRERMFVLGTQYTEVQAEVRRRYVERTYKQSK